MSNITQLRPQSDNTVETENPATGEVIFRHQKQSRQEASALIDKADEVFQQWRNVAFEKRAKIISAIADLLEDRKEMFALKITSQMGKPIAQARAEVDNCINICRYNAQHGASELQDEKREMANGGYGIITYQPVGVILAMQPWNFPLYQAVRYSIPNLLAGNTTVLKHAEIVWDIAKTLEALYVEAGVPKGAFAVAYVDDETIDSLIAHPKVRGVTLTGSAAAGKIVAAKAGEHLKKTVLELGGSDAYLVLEDADLDKIIPICVKGRVNNGGQTCVAAKRFIVVDAIYEAFKTQFVKAMREVTFGDPTDESYTMGSLAREDLRDKLHKQVQASIDKGAVCLVGGKIPEHKGYFYPATVLEHVAPGMPAYEEELFGPVASLIKAKDEEDAIRIANDHNYGLGGGVFSKDEARAIEIARTRLDTGMVNVNGYNGSQANLPFGGVKDSGWGRELGGFGIREFVNIKTVMVSKPE